MEKATFKKPSVVNPKTVKEYFISGIYSIQKAYGQ